MKIGLSSFSLMPHQLCEALHQIKIRTTTQLLDAAAMPGGRRKLLDRTGLDEQALKP
jgi:hypothetical protein